MDIYPLLRPLIFRLDAEAAHHLTLAALRRLEAAGLLGLAAPAVPASPRRVMGLDFPNPVGLAAGLDKDGVCIDAWAALGFGFIEVGTVTPRPQPGNPRPRLFRIPEARAIVNRFGFNNAGVDALLENVARSRFRGILGINIGKNFDTPIEAAVEDYLTGLRKVYARASYVTVNISSPNTRNLRDLQQAGELGRLLAALKAEQRALAERHGKYTPIAVKVAPDLEAEQVGEMAALFREHRIDGVIATNTTLSREGVAGLPHGEETGGLSGAPVRDRSTRILAAFHRALAGEIPLIGVGGILSGEDARGKIEAGASLVQLYSGLVYRGPRLVAECARALAEMGY